ncbi:MAG: hypothetical protein R8L53_00635 [Mariprofundales bacterium]
MQKIAIKLIGVLCALLIIAISLPLVFAVKHTHIDGVDNQVRMQIRQVLQKYEQDSWLHLPWHVQNVLQRELPVLESVQVQRVWPHSLWIRATARRPFVLWHEPGVDLPWLVDVNGVAYIKQERGTFLDAPLLRTSRLQLSFAVGLLRDLINETPERWKKLSECRQLRTGWRLNFEQKEYWILPYEYGSAKLDMKRIHTLLDTYPWNEGLWQVDARLPSRWFIRQSNANSI